MVIAGYEPGGLAQTFAQGGNAVAGGQIAQHLRDGGRGSKPGEHVGLGGAFDERRRIVRVQAGKDFLDSLFCQRPPLAASPSGEHAGRVVEDKYNANLFLAGARGGILSGIGPGKSQHQQRYDHQAQGQQQPVAQLPAAGRLFVLQLKEADRAEGDPFFFTFEQQVNEDGNGQSRHSGQHERVGKQESWHG